TANPLLVRRPPPNPTHRECWLYFLHAALGCPAEQSSALTNGCCNRPRPGAPRARHHARRAGAQAWSGRLRLPGPPKSRSRNSTVRPKRLSFAFYVNAQNPPRIRDNGASLSTATNGDFGDIGLATTV